MALVTYIKEFFYILSGMTALLACVSGVIFLALAPFGAAIYITDVKGYPFALGMIATISIFCFYWITARHFNWVEGIK